MKRGHAFQDKSSQAHYREKKIIKVHHQKYRHKHSGNFRNPENFVRITFPLREKKSGSSLSMQCLPHFPPQSSANAQFEKST